MTERIQLVVEASDAASGILRGITGEMGAMGGVVEELTTGNIAWGNVAQQAGKLVYDALKESLNATIEYANQVRELSLVSGESAENTSRFIQVLDDYKIGADDAMIATRALTKEGLTPSIETLAKLSDEYLSINDAQAKNEFILKNLGRAGLQWVDVLNKGGAALLAQGDAVDESLILTQKAVDNAREYEIALDDWNDSVLALKISIGNALLPALTDLIDSFGVSSRANEIMIEQYGKMYPLYTEQGKAAYAVAAAELEATNATKINAAAAADNAKAADDLVVSDTELSAINKRVAEEAKAAADALREMTATNNDLLSLTMNISKEMDTYTSKLAELTAQYGADSEQVRKLQKDHNAAFASIATDLLIAKLKADGFTDAEYQMAIVALQSSGQIDKASANTALSMDKIATAAQNAGTAGMASFGDIMARVMADGVISNEELQSALDELNATQPTAEVEGIGTALTETKATGVVDLSTLQGKMDAINTNVAVGEVDDLQARLYNLIAREYNVQVNLMVNGVLPSTNSSSIESEQNTTYTNNIPPIPFGASASGIGSTTQHIAIYGATTLMLAGEASESLLEIR